MTIGPERTLRRLVWRRILDDQSMEECTVMSSARGFAIQGRLIGADDGEPLGVSYDIRCDPGWSAETLTIEQRRGDATTALRLVRSDGGWLVDGRLEPRLAGCAEPDLGCSPATNALAIRRLDLAIGQSAEIACAWIKVPALSIESSRQRYERLAEREYRYTNVASGFAALIAVDALALPITYQRVWTRIADWQGEQP